MRNHTRRLHRDERGAIMIVSVFAVLLLTMLLGMVVNAGKDVDDKLRMQNAADAAAYSGGLVVARGMNGLAFTNHLLCDVFAMTAFMREGRDRNGEPYAAEILEAWANVAPKFERAPTDKFQALGRAIIQKVPLEQELVFRYSEWAAAAAEQILPIVEPILIERMIPEFQRALVAATPDIAQTATAEVTRRHNKDDENGAGLVGVLWRTSGVPVGGESDAFLRTLPVVDPVTDALPNQAQYIALARSQRRKESVRYLRDWNQDAMVVFDYAAKMSQFNRLWRHFTCAQLNYLLEVEYPLDNLPFVIHTEAEEVYDGNLHLDTHFTFVAVVYWHKTKRMMPGLFHNPIDGDLLTYAQVRFFVPRKGPEWYYHHYTPHDSPAGAIGGHQITFPPQDDDPGATTVPPPDRWEIRLGPGFSEEWNLMNQHWTVQLVPATVSTLPAILQTNPPVPDASIRVPYLGDMTTDDIQRISPH
ncbi:MAG: hypothetical protein JW818_06910 [Pirellulales bacterium]|nr:hypothetical protein [Pirellulales bacterium]